MNLLLILLALGPGLPGQDPRAPLLLRAHTHNDYQHERPLEDAADLGYRSVEVDVFPGGERLFVGHDLRDLILPRSFEDLYLDPLIERLAGSARQSRANAVAAWLM